MTEPSGRGALVGRWQPEPALGAAGLLAEHPAQVSEYRGGNAKLFGFLVGWKEYLFALSLNSRESSISRYIVRWSFSAPAEGLASLARSAGSAIILVTLVSLAASWINWGFGLVVGALFAKELARQVRVDYRLLVASAYSGFLVWHGGLAGSVPLTIATSGHFSEDKIGIISTSDTIFAFFNLAIVIALFILVPLINRLMLPSDKESIYVDPKLLEVGRAFRCSERQWFAAAEEPVGHARDCQRSAIAQRARPHPLRSSCRGTPGR